MRCAVLWLAPDAADSLGRCGSGEVPQEVVREFVIEGLRARGRLPLAICRNSCYRGFVVVLRAVPVTSSRRGETGIGFGRGVASNRGWEHPMTAKLKVAGVLAAGLLGAFTHRLFALPVFQLYAQVHRG